MKNWLGISSFLLLCLISLYSYYGTWPRYTKDAYKAETEFSVDRAMDHLEEITQEPHYVGSEAHTAVRNYLINELEKLGLEVEIQEGYSLNPQAKTMNKPINIFAKITGSAPTKSLVLLSHYDSVPQHSPGASDDGVGLAAILESLRAYMATGAQPKNDIIILFSDAEELGLDGAKLFVEEYEELSDIGLVLNFEARGTGGPSNMILETNGGNKNLIKAFKTANPTYPVASSLMYSVYKLLPNDTDSTVFREQADIDSYFFAFIDRHYNYHTALDNIENLNWSSLAHQGTYLYPLLQHFADADLSNLKSDVDHVYTNFPIIKILHYPFSWIYPLLILAWIAFGVLTFYSIKKHISSISAIGKAFIPFAGAFIAIGLLGYFVWPILLKIYPQYSEIQQGFTYNGHYYIASIVAMAFGISFLAYYKGFNKIHPTALLFPFVLIWLIINTLLASKLKGGTYFIIPVYFALVAMALYLRKKPPHLLLLSLLSFSALYIFVPLIQYFPVGLGLKMLILSAVFSFLLFGLLLPVFSAYKKPVSMGIGFSILALVFFGIAHFQSDFTENRPKPNSLVYYADWDKKEAYWTSFDKQLDSWTQEILGDNPEEASAYIDSHSYSKYGHAYSYAKTADWVDFPDMQIMTLSDEIVGDERQVKVLLNPQRATHKLELFQKDSTALKSLYFNGKELPVEMLNKSYRGTQNKALVIFHKSPEEHLELSFSVAADEEPEFYVLEYSYDLLEQKAFSISERQNWMYPKAFVTTDAVVVKRSFKP